MEPTIKIKKSNFVKNNWFFCWLSRYCDKIDGKEKIKKFLRSKLLRIFQSTSKGIKLSGMIYSKSFLKVQLISQTLKGWYGIAIYWQANKVWCNWTLGTPPRLQSLGLGVFSHSSSLISSLSATLFLSFSSSTWIFRKLHKVTNWTFSVSVSKSLIGTKWPVETQLLLSPDEKNTSSNLTIKFFK